MNSAVVTVIYDFAPVAAKFRLSETCKTAAWYHRKYLRAHKKVSNALTTALLSGREVPRSVHKFLLFDKPHEVCMAVAERGDLKLMKTVIRNSNAAFNGKIKECDVFSHALYHKHLPLAKYILSYYSDRRPYNHKITNRRWYLHVCGMSGYKDGLVYCYNKYYAHHVDSDDYNEDIYDLQVILIKYKHFALFEYTIENWRFVPYVNILFKAKKYIGLFRYLCSIMVYLDEDDYDVLGTSIIYALIERERWDCLKALAEFFPRAYCTYNLEYLASINHRELLEMVLPLNADKISPDCYKEADNNTKALLDKYRLPS